MFDDRRGVRGKEASDTGAVWLCEVPARLTGVELAWLHKARESAASGGAVEGVPAHWENRADRRLVRQAEDRAMAAVAAQRAERELREIPVLDGDDDLPTGNMGFWDMMMRRYSARPMLPFHETNTARAGVLSLLVQGGGGPRIMGPPIGVDLWTDELFTWDPWGAYDAGLTTSPDLLVCGLRSNGKSFCTKVLACRAVGYGRRVIVQSDREGEWGRVARAIGGQVVSPGGGHYLNPLALAPKSPSMSVEEWRQEATASRLQAMKEFAAALDEDGRMPLDAEQTAMLGALVRSFDVGPMCLHDAVRRLADWDWVDREHMGIDGLHHDRTHAREVADSVCVVYANLVGEGSYAGAFDRESTITLDKDCPMIVFDTSGPAAKDPMMKRVYTSAISNWIDRLLQGRDGTRRIVVLEEAWDVLANPMLIKPLETRMRSAGHWGCSTWIVVHGMDDLENYGAAGSQHRNTVEALLRLIETRVIYKHQEQALDVLRRVIPDLTDDELALIPKLKVGSGIWRIGRDRRLIWPTASPFLYPHLDTSALRGGGQRPLSVEDIDDREQQ